MPTATYTPLATVTLASSASSVTFSNIPATYRDLILVVTGTGTINTNPTIQFNADTGNNYSNVWMGGSGSSASSGQNSSVNYNFAGAISPSQSNNILQIMDYSATDKHKTSLVRGNSADSTLGEAVSAWAGRWANTAAITSVRFFLSSGNLNTGTTLSLYGIVA
jgi:hypothetical protein